MFEELYLAAGRVGIDMGSLAKSVGELKVENLARINPETVDEILKVILVVSRIIAPTLIGFIAGSFITKNWELRGGEMTLASTMTGLIAGISWVSSGTK